MRGRLAWWAAVLTVGGCLAWAPQAGAHVYWSSQSGSIGRADLDGSSPVSGFIPGGSLPNAVAVDRRYVYWTNVGLGTIGRANLDGTGANQSFITGARNPLGVTVDDGHLYWSNNANNAPRTIGRANLDGTGVDQNFITGLNSPVGVAVDERHVYWSDLGLGIGRANLDGSDAHQSFIDAFANGIAIDSRHVYWASPATGEIGRANLDGTDPSPSLLTGVGQASAVAVDGRHLYWINFGTIGRANLDGSDPDASFIGDGVSFGNGVAVDGGPAGTASASAASLAFGTQPLGTLGAPQSLTVTNTGHGNLEIDAARVAAGDIDDFLISRDGCSRSTLPIGASCTLGVRFGPSAGGERRGTLELTGNDPATPLRVALQGTAGQLPQGPAGAPGAPGAPGAQGPAGPAGRPGRVRLVTCRIVKVKVRGRRVKRRRCKTRMVSSHRRHARRAATRARIRVR